MANYDDLPGLTGRLKRAAIDAYMKDEDYTRHDTFYSYQAVISEFPVSYHVSRPGEDGQGGGVFEVHDGGSKTDDGKTKQFQANFDTIRGRVDNALKKWQDLPNPSEFYEYVESLRQAHVTLSVMPAPDGGSMNGAGVIGGSLNTIRDNSMQMAGGIIAAFKSKFLNALGSTIAGHCGITYVLGQALTAEREIWDRARTNIADAVENSANALDAYARKSDHDWKISLAILGAAVAGASAFFTGGTSGVFVGLTGGLSLLKETGETLDRAGSKPGPRSFDELMRTFEKNLDEINSAIKREEELLERNLAENIRRVSTDPGYDLDKPLQGVDDDSDLHTSAGKMIINSKQHIFDITNTDMPAIAAELIKAQGQISFASNGAPFYRDAAVGLGHHGPFRMWADLLWMLWSLIGDLEWEIRAGATTLKLAIEDMGRADSAAEDALEKHYREIAQGSGFTPYGSQRPPR